MGAPTFLPQEAEGRRTELEATLRSHRKGQQVCSGQGSRNPGSPPTPEVGTGKSLTHSRPQLQAL